LEKADAIEKSIIDSADEVEFCLPAKEFADAFTNMNKGKWKIILMPNGQQS
jgi:hypothetical protein